MYIIVKLDRLQYQAIFPRQFMYGYSNNNYLNIHYINYLSDYKNVCSS